MTARERSFGQLVFDYLTTIVPYWRVSDDAWLLEDGSYLAGIGVLRNYGGDVLVVTLSVTDLERPLDGLPFRAGIHPNRDRCVVVADDRAPGAAAKIALLLSPVQVIAWSERHRLAEYVVQDA